MAASRVFLTKRNGEQVAVKPSEVAHYHQYGEFIKVCMRDGWVHEISGSFEELVLLLDPIKEEVAA